MIERPCCGCGNLSVVLKRAVLSVILSAQMQVMVNLLLVNMKLVFRLNKACLPLVGSASSDAAPGKEKSRHLTCAGGPRIWEFLMCGVHVWLVLLGLLVRRE
ncbi:hypothetical protein V8C42DRAFT_311581 [Trichoderma barbatum]